MFKLKLNKKHVAYVQKIKNKNLLKLFVVIMYVWNVLMNYLNKENNMSVQNVDKKIGLFQLTNINIKDHRLLILRVYEYISI